jgi:hypothetical protein
MRPVLGGWIVLKREAVVSVVQVFLNEWSLFGSEVRETYETFDV